MIARMRAATARWVERNIICDEPEGMYVPSRLDALDGVGVR